MIRKEECKHKQLIQYQSFAPQCQDCGVYMVTRKRNPLSSKSFFDFSEEEQKEILNQAADDSNKAQQELMDTEEQVCTCGMEPCDPKCKACPLFHVHTPPLDKPFNIEKFKKDAAKVRATFDTEEQVCPCHCHVFCPVSISFQEAGDIKAMCSCSPQECIHCTPLLDTDEGYYDSTMHWHTGKPPTKGNTPEIPDSSEAWEERFDGLMYNENGTTPTEIKTLIHTLLKHKESMTLQTVREKVEALPKLVTPDFNDAPLLNRHDVLKLLERR
jgi:hypothetical protein